MDALRKQASKFREQVAKQQQVLPLNFFIQLLPLFNLYIFLDVKQMLTEMLLESTILCCDFPN